MITDYQKIAAIANLTGKRIRLGMMETVADWLVLGDTALISIARVQCDFKRGDELVITRRGYTMWTFYRQEGEWKFPEPVTYWMDDHEQEVYKTYAREANEYLAKRDWEEMCYRPGSSISPMDGPNARLS